MAEKKADTNANNFGLGEISTIRNILMGQQMSEYESRFGHLEQRILAASDDQGDKLNAFQDDAQERFAALEKDMNTRFDKLENMLREGLESLKAQTAETRKNDNESLGKMLSEIGDALTKR